MSEKRLFKTLLSCSFVQLLFSLISFITSIWDTLSRLDTYGWEYKLAIYINDNTVIIETVYVKQYFAFSLLLGIILMFSLYVYGSLYFYSKERGYLNE